jgi:multidrug efflux pump
MSLGVTSIKRPVLTLVMSTFLLLLGWLGVRQMGIREYPMIDPPIVNVATVYKGASAEVMDNQVTQVLEQSLNGIDGIRTISSQSRDERSNISVEFDLGADLERAANDVRDRVSRAVRSLPTDITPPTVAKADANASPVVVYTVQSDARGLLDLNDQAVRLQEKLQTVPGVSEVRVWGERKYAMRLRLDPLRLATAGLVPQDVKDAVSAENAELPGGQIEGKSVSLALQARTGLRTPEEFRRVVVKAADGRILRLEDVGRVELSSENERTLLRGNGRPMIALAVIPQPGSDQIAIVDEVERRLGQLRRDLPPDVQVKQAFDNTQFVRKALFEVGETVLIAFLLVLAVIFVFLRDWRSTLIPLIAIPVSLLGVFFFAWLLGFSINVLTLLGVVLSIGMVVDDAIVVLENIYAHIENGLSPRQAAMKGVDEIFFAVLSTTLVLCAVFTPLLFLPGFTGRLFREFGFVVGGSVLLSGFVALTLAAMLSSRFLRPHGEDNRLHRATEPFFVWMTSSYRKQLAWFLAHRWIAIPMVVGAMLVAMLAYRALPRELAPMEDRNAFTVLVTGHEGATFDYMDRVMRGLTDSAIAQTPEARTIMSITSPGWAGNVNAGQMRVYLVPAGERDRTQAQIAQHYTGKILPKLAGVRAFATQEQTIKTGSGSSLPVQIVLQSSDMDSLRAALPAFLAAARQDTTFATVDVDLKFTRPQLDISVDRDKLRLVGVSPMDVAQALQMAFGEQNWGTFLKDGKQYNVIGELDSASRDTPGALDRIQLRSNAGDMIPLGALVKVTETSVPPQRFRFNRWFSATVSASPAPGYTVGDGNEAMLRIAKTTLGPSFRTEFVGTSRDFAESSKSTGQVFLLAVLIVYLILAAQFESFRDPFTILLTVPLALSGALGALWLTGNTLNLFSQIGLVLLVGLVTKNGILIVEFANQRRRAGLPPGPAVLEAATARLRPILMTTLATLLGILPVALALGAASQSRVPMGIAVVGGLLTALALTLVVVPAVYTMIAPREMPLED